MNIIDVIIGLNVEQKKKKLTIGVELASRPQLLLFLDEPSSGKHPGQSLTCSKSFPPMDKPFYALFINPRLLSYSASAACSSLVPTGNQRTSASLAQAAKP